MVRTEGNFDAEALVVLGDVLIGYARQGVERVVLDADGIVSIDLSAVRRWPWPERPQVTFRTTRPAMHQQLTSLGLHVTLEMEDRPPSTS